MSEDMSNLMNQINNMIKNNEIPDEIKSMMNHLATNSQPSTERTDSKDVSSSSSNTSSSSSSEDNSIPEFDFATIMKLKKIMDSMKDNRNDPRANLLKSLKPYLKESRKEKVDQYIQIFGMGKIFEMMGPLGGEKHK